MRAINKELKQEASEIVKDNFALKNKMLVPSIEKVVLSMGFGKDFKNADLIAKAFEILKTVSGQYPVYTKAKKSVANFNIREGMQIGLMVTLRKKKMDEFLTRLCLQAMPRLRDFEGFNASSFNGKAFSWGVKDSSKLFQEVVDLLGYYSFSMGMNITFVFNNSNKEAQKLYMQQLQFPFKN